MNKTVLITTMCIQCSGSATNYVAAARKMILSYLKYTPHPILMVTNKPEAFSDISSDRLYLSYMHEGMNKYKNGFDYTLKMEALGQAAHVNVDAVYWIDADTFTEGWDEESFQKLLESPYDVFGIHPIGIKDIPHPSGKVKRFHSHHESRIIYNNMNVLREMIRHWNDVDWDTELEMYASPGAEWEMGWGRVIESWRTKEGSDGIVLATTLDMAQGTYLELHPGEHAFTDYERVVKRLTIKRSKEKIISRFWQAIK